MPPHEHEWIPEFANAFSANGDPEAKGARRGLTLDDVEIARIVRLA